MWYMIISAVEHGGHMGQIHLLTAFEHNPFQKSSKGA